MSVRETLIVAAVMIYLALMTGGVLGSVVDGLIGMVQR